MTRLVFWNVRSKWDYFSFIALIQWVFLGTAALFGFISLVFEPAAIVAVLALVGGVFLNFATPLVVLSTWRGSRHHEHLSPNITYHMFALLFGPLVGVHYLLRTGKSEA